MASPTTWTRTGWGTSTVVTEPRCSRPAVAAPWLMTTWCRPAGTCPLASRYGVSAGSAIQFPADRGGPSPPTGLPSAPSSVAAPAMDGCASATPGTARTVASSDAGMGGRGAVIPLPVAVALRTTALVPEVAVANSRLKFAVSVSPKVERPGQERHAEPDRDQDPGQAAFPAPRPPWP